MEPINQTTTAEALATQIGTALGGPVVGAMAGKVIAFGALLIQRLRSGKGTNKDKADLHKAAASIEAMGTQIPQREYSEIEKYFMLIAKKSKMLQITTTEAMQQFPYKGDSAAPMGGGTPDAGGPDPKPTELTAWQKFMQVFENPVMILILLGTMFLGIVALVRSMSKTKTKEYTGRQYRKTYTKSRGKASTK